MVGSLELDKKVKRLTGKNLKTLILGVEILVGSQCYYVAAQNSRGPV